MGQNRHIAGSHQIEEEGFEVRRHRMMRRLDQHVARIGERNQLSGAQAGHEILTHMHIGPMHQTQRDGFSLKALLQRRDRLPDRRSGIMVKAW